MKPTQEELLRVVDALIAISGKDSNAEWLMKAIRALIENRPKVNMDSWFYRNCKTQRRKGAKICQECPFRKGIEQQEAGVEVEE
jgi:hypothetical protein